MTLKRFPTLHPLLISAYPIVYLYGANIGEMSAAEILLPLAVTWALVGIIWITFARLSGDTQFGAIVASGFVVLFCLLIPAYQIVKGLGLPKLAVLASLSAVFIVSAVVIARARRKLGWLSTFLDIAAGVAFVMLAGTTAANALSSRGIQPEPPGITFAARHDAPRPDIYFILLDGYGRSDVLKDLYDFDNSWFTGRLEELGFYVAAKSTANYSQTMLSVASTLNMTYLDEVAGRVGTQSRDRAALRQLVGSNDLVASLKGLGYKFVTFSSGFSGTDMKRVDIRMSSVHGLTEFQNLLLSLSPIPTILDNMPMGPRSGWQFYAHRSTIQYTFDNLGQLPETAEPKFVFAHVISPHPPFLFGPEGQAANPPGAFTLQDASHISKSSVEEYVRGYSRQARYISAQAARAAAAIRQKSPDAVIIIQGDHGPGGHLNWNSYKGSNMRSRMGILNAYHVPPDLKARLYPNISPVNTFRLLLNHLFGATLPPLHDDAYFSTWRRPYEFIKVTDEVNVPEAPREVTVAKKRTR